MAIYDHGVLISGTPKHSEAKTTWRDIGDKVIFAVGQFSKSESTSITVSFA